MMAQELIYTSAPEGLRPGSRGFCTVACTTGMSDQLIRSLEALSGYRHIDGMRKEDAPVVFSLLRVSVRGRDFRVLSRVADAGMDYTQRTNKIAHHLVLDQPEWERRDPAWLLAREDLLLTAWEGAPRELDARTLPHGKSQVGKCEAWEALTKDAGWGGVLAETALDSSFRQAVVIYKPEMRVLPLVIESLKLLPVEDRWNVTFSTYFTKLPPGVDCKWRFVLEGTDEAKLARQAPHTRVIDLCQPLVQARGTELVEIARTGVIPQRETNGDDMLDYASPGIQLDDMSNFTSTDAPLAQSPVRSPYVDADRRKLTPRTFSKTAVTMAIAASAAVLLITFALWAMSRTETVAVVPRPVAKPEKVLDARALEEAAHVEKLNDRIKEADALTAKAKTLFNRAQQLETSWQDAAGKVQGIEDKLKAALDQFDDADQQVEKQKIVDDAVQNSRDAAHVVDGVKSQINPLRQELDQAGSEAQSIATRAKADVRSAKSSRVRDRLDEFDRRIGEAIKATSKAQEFVRKGNAKLNELAPQVERVDSYVVTMRDQLPKAGSGTNDRPEAVDKPFRDLTAKTYFALPPPGTLAESAALKELCSIYVDDPKQCELELKGDVIGGGKIIRLDDPVDNDKVRFWPVVIANTNAAGSAVKTPIATFTLRGQSLSFQWLEKYGESAEEKQLANCALVLTAGEHTREAALRVPATEETKLNLDGTSAVKAEPFQIPVYPRSSDIVLEVRFEGFSKEDFPAVERPEQRQIVLPNASAVKPLPPPTTPGRTPADVSKNTVPDSTARAPQSSAGSAARDALRRSDNREFGGKTLWMAFQFVELVPDKTTAAADLSVSAEFHFHTDIVERLSKNFGTEVVTIQNLGQDLHKVRGEIQKTNEHLEKNRAERAEVKRKLENPNPSLDSSQAKKVKDDLEKTNVRLLGSKGQLEDLIAKYEDQKSYLEKAIAMLEGIKSHGKLHFRIFARYPTHEVDLVKLTATP
jgi:hypothetical protein